MSNNHVILVYCVALETVIIKVVVLSPNQNFLSLFCAYALLICMYESNCITTMEKKKKFFFAFRLSERSELQVHVELNLHFAHEERLTIAPEKHF